ncbi:MAG: hypothetical protein DRR08_08955 [Candidatus Parabeggiatoa sp. nov. 2]|nr:MAG: hypothetical protein B6247_11285 [Beggiatoa sp. 4572_84]RKZ61332.1 MAG: hypothetical protein DRR08_08955 [Gammaproteobacteria bacterium]
MREQVLKLYDNRLATLENNGQIAAGLPYLPLTGYLLWQVASQSAPQEWQTVLANQNIDLSHIVFPAHLTTYFQGFLDQLLTQWHDPNKAHRHIRREGVSPTAILLRLSEGLYVLDELTDKQGLDQAYLHLALADNPTHCTNWQQQIGKPLESLLNTLQSQWQTRLPNTPLPLILDAPNLPECQSQLEALPWYKLLFYNNSVQHLRDLLQHCDQLLKTDDKLKMQWRWWKTLHDAQQAQENWLKAVLLKLAPLPDGLMDTAAIVLGAVFINDSLHKATGKEKETQVFGLGERLGLLSDAERSGKHSQSVDESAPQKTTVKNAEDAKELVNDALTHRQLFNWAATNEESLLNWWETQPISVRQALSIPQAILEQEQTDLREALKAWQNGDTRPIMNYLQAAWTTAQQQAKPLAQIITALEKLTAAAAIVLGAVFMNSTEIQHALQSPNPRKNRPVSKTDALRFDSQSDRESVWKTAFSVTPNDVNDALTHSHLFDWTATHEESLLNWWETQPISVRQALSIPPAILKQKQTDLRAALKAWQNGDTSTIMNFMNYLAAAWTTAQQQAEPLAQIITALENQHLSERFDVVLAEGAIEEGPKQQALKAIICGSGQAELENAIANWLEKQGSVNCRSLPTAVARLKRRFECIAKVYPEKWPHSNWADVVNGWANTLLKEKLTEMPIREADRHLEIWELLERSRIAFTALTKRINRTEWAEETGEQLLKAFKNSVVQMLTQGPPSPQQPWPPLVTWLARLDKLIPTPPSIEACQTRLASENSALVQPFFDPLQHKLRVLWLDEHHLTLRDLPEDCAKQDLWTKDLIPVWIDGVNAIGTNSMSGALQKNWENVINSNPVTRFADTLSTWAQGLNQLTVIFPAPLGQLPWEALPQLEMVLVREISVAHWLKHTPSPSQEGSSDTKDVSWVVSDPSGETQCMVKEARWVAAQLNTTTDNAGASVFEALRHLNKSHRAHLVTHGEFIRAEPTASYLTLENQKGVILPLWMTGAIRVSADLVVLSACESNLNGQDTEGLLTPIGIGPSLAAAGAKTVVGTLWPCKGLAALCFSYYFYTIADKNKQMRWHQVVAQARRQLRQMTAKDLKDLATELGLDGLDKDDSQEPCTSAAQKVLDSAETPESLLFDELEDWAGFTVLGKC